MRYLRCLFDFMGPVCDLKFFPLIFPIYRPRRDGRLSWPWVAGWLHTEISVRHRELNPDTVAHLRPTGPDVD